MKKFIGIILGCAALAAAAADVVFDGNKAGVWDTKYFKDGNGVVTGTIGYSQIRSKEFIPVTAGKKYVVSGEFRLVDPPANLPTLYFGFFPYTADNKMIPFVSIYPIYKKLLVLAKDVKAGDKSIVLKEFAIERPAIHGRFVFNAKEDKSDLPNFDVTPAADWTKTKRNADGTVEVTFKGAINKSYPAGTVLRLHTAGSSYVYAGGRKIGSEWITFRKEFKTFYPGTAKIKPCMNLTAAKCQIEFRNVTVTEE